MGKPTPCNGSTTSQGAWVDVNISKQDWPLPVEYKLSRQSMFRSLRMWQWCDLKGPLFNIFNVPLYNLCNGLVMDAVACDHEVTQWLRWEKIIVCVNILAASNVRQSLICIKVYKLVFHGFSFAYFSWNKCAPWCVMFSFTVEQKWHGIHVIIFSCFEEGRLCPVLENYTIWRATWSSN